MPAESVIWRQHNFSGGMVSRRSPGLLLNNESEWMENMSITEMDYAVKRPGFTRVTTDPLDGAVQGIFEFQPYRPSLENMLMVMAGGTLYRWNDVDQTFDVVGSGFNETAKTRFVQFGNMLIILNGVDTPKKYFRPDDTDPWTLDDLGGNPPVASFGAVYYRHLFLNDVENPVRIFYSETDDPELGYASRNYLADMIVSDSSPVTGFLALDQELIVGKKRSITAIRGMDPRDFSISQNRAAYTNERGVVSHEGLIDVAGSAWFLSEDGVFSIRGPFDTPRQSYVIDGLFDNLDHMHSGNGFSVRITGMDQAIFFVQEFGSSHPNVAFVAHPGRGRDEMAAWTVWTGITATCGMRSFSSNWGEKFYIGTADGHVMVMQNATFYDHTAPVVARWRSRHLDFSRPDYLKSLREIVSEIEVDTATEVVVRYNTDRGRDMGHTTLSFEGAVFTTGYNATGDPLGGRQVRRSRFQTSSLGLNFHVEMESNAPLEMRISGAEARAFMYGRSRGHNR